MELTFDSEYKARAIRGFCHLYDGQEAIAAGLKGAWRAALCGPRSASLLAGAAQVSTSSSLLSLSTRAAALLPSDDIATAYRCHGLQLIRGDTVRSIAA